MSRYHSKPTIYGLICLGLVAVVACDVPGDGFGPSGSTGRSTTPKPKNTGSPGPGQTGASSSPGTSASTDPKKVGGDVEQSAPSSNTVRFVAVEPSAVALNAPYTDGTNPAGFPFSQSLRAVATLTGGGTASADVTWTSSDGSRVTVDSAGGVAVKSGAATGSVTVTAESKAVPGVKGVATVTVTADGLVRVAIEPPLPAWFSFRKETDVIVKRQGAAINASQAQDSLDLRLPAGSGYQLLVNRSVASDSVDATNGLLLSTALVEPVTVPVNAIATVSVTLQATDSLPQ